MKNMEPPDPSRPMLEVRQLSFAPKGTAVLKDVDLTVWRHQITAIAGADGAGKTTLLRVVSGLVREITGRVLFEGEEIGALPPWEVVKRGIVYVPEGMRVFPQMSVRENLEVGAYLKRQGLALRLERVFGVFPELREKIQAPAGLLSGGQQRMVTLARGLMSEPRLLLLDEPFMGLSPKLVTRFCNSFRDLRRSGITLLISGQHIRRVLNIAESAHFLKSGMIVCSGVGVELLTNRHLQDILFAG